jgi:outer membrane protein OmpA-like peptidoglycan-associated protein
MRTLKLTLTLLLVVFLATDCKKMSRTAKGGAIGAGVGGVMGGVIGYKAGNTAVGAIIGAAVGGVAGAAIGRYMDKQAAEIQKDLKGAKVERIGEGIKITFDSGILFNVNSYELKSEAKRNIEELAQTLKKYEDTNILIEGHTDDTGTEEYNKTLSENRAESVTNYAKSLGVAGARFSTIGYGEAQPIADNTTTSGKAQNRRVEIAIYANEKLKKAAKRGDI